MPTAPASTTIRTCASRITALALAAIAAGCTSRPAEEPLAAVDELQKELINPPGSEEIYRTRQLSQGVRSGRLLWVSGQVGIDPESGDVPEDVETQARFALRHLESVIAEAGGSLTDVVELVSYHTDMRELAAFERVKAEFFTEGHPAWTVVGVAALADPRFRIEVRATAVLGSGPALEEPLEEDEPATQTGT